MYKENGLNRVRRFSTIFADFAIIKRYLFKKLTDLREYKYATKTDSPRYVLDTRQSIGINNHEFNCTYYTRVH